MSIIDLHDSGAVRKEMSGVSNLLVQHERYPKILQLNLS